ncbi:hypothetical protein DFR29_12118 [Tahibacter aquaticus]|uniref:Uncharacterized protein n=1 Tax=Tahibacter aquaticus TaxID=520092 RepID=A0A4V3DL84_9GAMM|nr:hypothetical protein [Tahibacter aquaticus]TDR38346.1 hypothetical protein DFR29_12118 [Tahibacter aquaticus]
MKLSIVLLLASLMIVFGSMARGQHRTDHGYSPQHYSPQSYRDQGYYGSTHSSGHGARVGNRHGSGRADNHGRRSGYGYTAAYGHGYRGASIDLHLDTSRSRGHRNRRDAYLNRFDH